MLEAKTIPQVPMIWQGEWLEAVQVICPVCNGERMEPQGIGYKCCECGAEFAVKYDD